MPTPRAATRRCWRGWPPAPPGGWNWTTPTACCAPTATPRRSRWRGLIGAADGSIRASALAVRGTARHEAARARIDAGDRGPETRALLAAAREDLTAFLGQPGALDTAGAMRARLELIAADLRSMG